MRSVADQKSEKGGAPGVLGACPQFFLVNFSQFGELFKVFGENKGWIRHFPPDTEFEIRALAALPTILNMGMTTTMYT